MEKVVVKKPSPTLTRSTNSSHANNPPISNSEIFYERMLGNVSDKGSIIAEILIKSHKNRNQSHLDEVINNIILYWVKYINDAGYRYFEAQSRFQNACCSLVDEKRFSILINESKFPIQETSEVYHILLIILLQSNLSLKFKIEMLSLFLDSLFVAHGTKQPSFNDLVEYWGIKPYDGFRTLGESEYFDELASTTKKLLVKIAFDNKNEFLENGGFEKTILDLLNQKRSIFGFLENLFNMESNSIKACRKYGLIK